MVRWSNEQYKDWLGDKLISSSSTKKRSKYNAQKTVVDGITFDSKKEACRYVELKYMAKAKEISNLELQPRFRLLDPFTYKDEKIRAIDYIADFKYIDKETGKEVVEDVKGKKTQVYSIKKKLFLFKYGDRYEFKEV